MKQSIKIFSLVISIAILNQSCGGDKKTAKLQTKETESSSGPEESNEQISKFDAIKERYKMISYTSGRAAIKIDFIDGEKNVSHTLGFEQEGTTTTFLGDIGGEMDDRVFFKLNFNEAKSPNSSLIQAYIAYLNPDEGEDYTTMPGTLIAQMFRFDDFKQEINETGKFTIKTDRLQPWRNGTVGQTRKGGPI